MCARAAGVCLFQTRDPLTTRRQLKHSVKSNQWIIQLLVDEQYQRLLATHQDGVHIISLRNGNEEHVLPNKHSSSLTCSAVSNRLGYLFTASGDGSINVWSGSTGTFNLIHTLHGHTSTVTGLLAHPVESVIITSSLDGSICMWKLDTMEERNRYDFGVQIEELHLVGTNRLFCKTKDYIYVCHLTLCQGLVDVVYARREDRMFALLATHQVLVLDCKTNPSTTLQMWNPSTKDDTPLCISLLDRLDDLVEADILNQIDSTTPLLFAGHKTGKISLLFGGGTSLFDSVKAHQEEVVKLVVSSSLEKDSEDGQMLSVGTDMQLKMWRLETNERLTSRSGLSLQLSCVANISVSSVPRHCVLVRNTVAVIQNK
ncbi:uncharacterized protein LOC134193767 [Corticium candelabrum]|uniref:uncharacterized protein LOC134193767 n=1 Tax=Corticium candelabrum TaxID=121492 RepID=UPI002E2667BF|nr:uncharacterized protein LOC134193767 [Corticium candelabrum]